MSESEPAPPRVRHVIGCMTGTSLDGLDAALVRITGTGLDMRAEHLGLVSVPFEDRLRGELRALAEGEPRPAIDYLAAARRLGVMHAEACEQLRDEQGGVAVDFVVAHGQAICHAPRSSAASRPAEAGGPGGWSMSWQLLDPWPVVRRLGVPVCYDLRQADLIAGGEGAPITPIADPIVYGRAPATAVVNLGGVCNLTHWGRALRVAPPGVVWEVEAYDLCPWNLLLNGLAERLLHQPYDHDGAAAGRGRPAAGVRAVIAEAVERAEAGRRSLGRESLGPAWFTSLLTRCPEASPETWLASACSYLARRLVREVEGRLPSRAVIAGGGARHATLVQRVRRLACEPVAWLLSDDLGIPCEAREAVCFAVLGALSQDRVPITLPIVTGAEHPGVAGAWAGI